MKDHINIHRWYLSRKEKESLIGMLKYSYDEHVLEYLNYKKIRDVLSEAIEGLPARQKTVLSLYYVSPCVIVGFYVYATCTTIKLYVIIRH